MVRFCPNHGEAACRCRSSRDPLLNSCCQNKIVQQSTCCLTLADPGNTPDPQNSPCVQLLNTNQAVGVRHAINLPRTTAVRATRGCSCTFSRYLAAATAPAAPAAAAAAAPASAAAAAETADSALPLPLLPSSFVEAQCRSPVLLCSC
jgi:hypothetical protein